ncbi:unnamed protein product [Heterobilharzia americana]|nr:unnamed protein product [Heterobilharzia americana]
MPSLSENLKSSEVGNSISTSNQSHHNLSSNNNILHNDNTYLNSNGSPSITIHHMDNGNLSTTNEELVNNNNKVDEKIIIPSNWTTSIEPSLVYIDESEDLYNQSKQRICILECHLCESAETKNDIHQHNNGLRNSYRKSRHLQRDHFHEDDHINKNCSVHKQINGFMDHESNSIKWIERCKQFENEMKDLKRAKDKAQCQNVKYEEQINELKNKLNSKQDKIQSLLMELEQSNQRLNEIETQFTAYKSQTSQNEENYHSLSHDFIIMKQCKEQAELNAKNCENNRLLYEKRMKELDENYEKNKQRYYEDVQSLMSQLDTERCRADELLQKIEQNRRQNEDQIRKIEQSEKKRFDTLLEEGQKELRKQLSKLNEQIKEQQMKIFNQELKISTIESEKNELLQINKKSTDEQLELREQVKLIEHLLAVKDQDISMIQFECRLYSDKIKQIELEKGHLIEKGRLIKQRYQNKARHAWDHCQTVRARLNRRLIQIRYNRDLLSKHLRKQYEQMNRLNHLFWETGWAYVQTQNCLQDIRKQDKEYVDKEMQTIAVTNKIKQSNMAVDQMTQTEISYFDAEVNDDTVMSCAIAWISNDLDNLAEKLEKLIKYQGTEKCYDFEGQYDEELHIGINEKVSLFSLILGLKYKVNWLRRWCNQLTNSTLNNQNFENLENALKIGYNWPLTMLLGSFFGSLCTNFPCTLPGRLRSNREK